MTVDQAVQCAKDKLIDDWDVMNLAQLVADHYASIGRKQAFREITEFMARNQEAP